MKSARDVAIDVVHEFMGQGFSRDMFLLIIKDTGETGTMARKMVEAIEKAIEKDRASVRKSMGPS